MRRRRKGYLVLAFAVAVFVLVSWLASLFGGGSKPVDTNRGTVVPEPDRPPPVENGTEDPPAPDVPAIEGTIRDAAGNPVAGASILIVMIRDGERINLRHAADGRGRFAEEIPRTGDLVFLEVLRPGYPPIRERFEKTVLRPGETVRLDRSFPATFTLAGHVKTYAGPAVVGAEVKFGDWKTTTDAQGRFRIEDIDAGVLRHEPRPKLVVSHEKHRPVETAPDLDGERANPVDIQVLMEPR